MAWSADSVEKAVNMRGCGILALANAALVANLSPHVSATAAVLTVGIPMELRTFTAYKPRPKLILRSSTAAYFFQGLGFCKSK